MADRTTLSVPESASQETADAVSVQSIEPYTGPAIDAPVEPEDAYLTGSKRSLQRRVLGLNVDGGQAQRPSGTPAGQHASGSFLKPTPALKEE